jgi:pimeloyl-ACP methyl ester carboxylesterase
LATAEDGETLFCRDVGAGAPFVLVHGWGLSSQMWQQQTGPLVDAGFRCISYDRRGHGRSSPAATGYDYDTLANDLAAVLAHHDLQGVTLVGHSMGCAEILRFLTRHGSGRVARIALIAPLAPVVLRMSDNPDGVPIELFEQQWASWRTDFPAWVEANRQPFFTADTSPAMMSWGVGLLLATHLDVALATSRESITADLRRDLTGIDRPVLVIHGNRDASVPLELGQRTAAAIGGARLSVYDGAPHGLFLTHSQRLNQELIAFARS